MILYEKRTPRWMHLIALLLTIGLTGAMTYFVFLREPSTDAFEPAGEIDGGFKMAFGFFILIGVFMAGVFARRLIKNPAYFVITEEGFEYSPGGVSTGLIRWGDILEFKEEAVVTSGSGIGGPVREAIVAVVLRNPEEYLARFPAALKPLLAIRGKMNSSALLLNPRNLGRDYPSIKTIMQEQVNRHAGKKT